MVYSVRPSVDLYRNSNKTLQAVRANPDQSLEMRETF